MSLINREKQTGSRLYARMWPGGLSLVVALAVTLLSAPSPRAGELSLGGPPEDIVEAAIEDDIEDRVAEAAEEAAQEAAEEAVEERILSLGGAPIEQKVEDRIEETIEGSVLDQVEQDVEQDITESIAADVEDRVEEAVEDTIEQGMEDNLQQVVESSVEQAVEQSVEASVQDSVEDAVATGVEQAVVQNLEQGVEDSLEQGVENSLEQTVENSLEQTVENSLEQGVEHSLEQTVENSVEQGVQDSVEQGVETQVALAVEEQLENEVDEIIEGIESSFEVDEDRIHKDQWLVMAEPEVFDKLAQEGYLFATVTELPGMGMRLAEVAAPSSFDISRVRQGVIDIVGKERAEVDLNHIYTAGDSVDAPYSEGISPRAAISFPADIDAMSLRIGMIDSSVDTSHPSLRTASIHARSFTREDASTPNFHGTAIASIIAANTSDYLGLAPKAQVYAASVFERDAQRGEIASTVSLVRALDWLLSCGVDVVNISLAGPPNRLLEAALARAQKQGVMILAAAGNGGPMATPMYPAAYESVVAVTAVDALGKVFRLANRGKYLDLAAPGVSLLHARAGGGFAASSGTSFAVPFAAAAAARLRQLQPGGNALQIRYESARDLGPPGRDEIYGYGLLSPSST